MSRSSRPNYYAVIPAHVRYDNGLTYLARIIYGEIAALSNALGYCYATNGYFARLYGCSSRTVSAAIGQLASAGLIIIRTVEHRRLMTVYVHTSSLSSAPAPQDDPDIRALADGAADDGVSLAELFARVYKRRRADNR